MAPANSSSKSRKAQGGATPAATAAATTSKPAQKKTLVPALPLPYVKRQNAAAAPAAAAVVDKSTESRSTNQSVAAAGANEVRGTSSGGKVSPATHPKDETDASAHEKPDDNAPVVANGDSVEATPNQTFVSVKQDIGDSQLPTVAAQTANQESATPTESQQQAQSHATYNGAPVVADSSYGKPPDSQNTNAPKPRPPPAVSPTRYQMPPSFQPGNRPPMMPANNDMQRGPRPPMHSGHPHVHQAHPSNGSVHFGAFHDSQTSSPAPPNSGGIAPPPGMPFPDGRQPFMGPGPNGYPPMMPYGAEMMPLGGFDNYGRPNMGYAPVDSFPPRTKNNNFGPSTPHSFHDSHSSGADESAAYNQYARGPVRNGGPGPGDDMSNPNRMYGGPNPRMMPNQGLPPHMMPPSDPADDLVHYTQQQFGNLELADCTLELRYLDDRARPVRIPAHRFMLNRSAELSMLLRQQTLPPSPPDRSQQTLLIETSSKWIRSDAFYMAAQRLYGMPLLHHPGPRNHMESGDFADAGSAMEQLDFALSYAASGHLLGWVPVIRRGCEVATQLISWQTVERVVEFALDGYNDRGTHDTYKYGEGSRIILDAVVTFVVHNFPPTFELDTDVAAPVQYARLPMHPPAPTQPAAVTPQQQNSAVKEGSPVQLGRGRRSQKITNIQFGDMSLTDGKPSQESVTPKASRQAQPVSHAVLSRLLLNIPFAQLKMILESSGSGNVNGWANAESRYRIVKAAVEERESRRVKAVQAVIAGQIVDSDAIRNNLRAPEPRNMAVWSVLGWQEDLLPYGNADGPSLGRKWSPLTEPQNGPVSEYP